MLPSFWVTNRGGGREGARGEDGQPVAGRRRVRRVITAKLFSYYKHLHIYEHPNTQMTQIYSNARLSKPSTSPLKAPRSAVDEFEVGTHRPSNEHLTQPSPRTLSFPVTARRLSSCSMPP